MMLNSGNEVDVLGQVMIDKRYHMICRLKEATYVNGTLVRYVCFLPNEFKEFVEHVRTESDSIQEKE